MQLRVCGQDPSLRHWGLAIGVYDTVTKLLTLDKVSVIEPELSKSKQVRQNSLDLESANQLCRGAIEATEGVHAVFVEVPVGSQSARAMASYGICVGVLGALRATGIPFFEVTPTQVKLAGAGIKTATKQAMIQWAMAKHPEGNWPMYKQKGQIIVSEAKAEHMADATAAIYAGLSCNSFQQLLAILSANQEVQNAYSTEAN